MQNAICRNMHWINIPLHSKIEFKCVLQRTTDCMRPKISGMYVELILNLMSVCVCALCVYIYISVWIFEHAMQRYLHCASSPNISTHKINISFGAHRQSVSKEERQRASEKAVNRFYSILYASTNTISLRWRLTHRKTFGRFSAADAKRQIRYYYWKRSMEIKRRRKRREKNISNKY